MFAGVPSKYAAASSTSTAAAVRAGLMTTSTPSISSVCAPLTAASNISCRAGEGVWWTTSSLGMIAELRRRPGQVGGVRGRAGPISVTNAASSRESPPDWLALPA